MQLQSRNLTKFLNRYKRLDVVKTDDGDWSAYNYRKEQVMSFAGRKSSILLLNKLYRVDSDKTEWLEGELNKLLKGEEVVQG